MLDKDNFKKIQKELQEFEEKREEVIQLSRQIITLSKRIIYGLQRNDVDKKLIAEIRQMVKKLPKETYDTGMQSVAVQEYVEAVCFYEMLITNKVPTDKDLGVYVYEYLLGLCDLTGELVRKAVQCVINKDYQQALNIKDLVEDIYGEFLKLDLRNGELRKKADSIKWNLKKLEDVAYDLKIKGMA